MLFNIGEKIPNRRCAFTRRVRKEGDSSKKHKYKDIKKDIRTERHSNRAKIIEFLDSLIVQKRKLLMRFNDGRINESDFRKDLTLLDIALKNSGVLRSSVSELEKKKSEYEERVFNIKEGLHKNKYSSEREKAQARGSIKQFKSEIKKLKDNLIIARKVEEFKSIVF